MPTARQYCTFYLGAQCFGLDVLQVQEIVRYQPVTRVPLASPTVHGLMNLRGQIVTTIDLGRRLRLPDRGDARREPVNVVVDTDEGAVALLVDEVGDVLEVAPEQFENPPETLSGEARRLISGAYKLPERLVVILDLEEVLATPDD